MNLSAVAVTPGGVTESAVKTWSVNSPVTRGYQTALYLRFDTQGAADGIEIDTAGCQFEAVFQSLDYNALSAGPIPVATLTVSKDQNAVIVKLDGPRQVLSVTLNPPRPVDLHRADGSVQADKPADSSGFTDVNFGVQVSGPPAIMVDQVTAVNVRGIPGNARVGIAPADLSSPAMFWPTPDAAGQLTVHASTPFAAALQTFVTGQWTQAVKAHQQNPAVTLPSYIDAAVVIQSDAPCRISISQFNVRFHRLLSSFTTGSEKQVLRYSGKTVERQSVAVQLPPNATVTSGTLRINESFHPGGASIAEDNQDLLSPEPIAQDRGIHISAGGITSGGQRLNPPAAASIAGVALGVMALAPGTQLAVQLQSDQNGAPSGKKLAEASLSLPQVGRQQWSVASLKNQVALPASPYWILVSATKGSAIWMVNAGGDPARLFDNINGIPSEAARLDGFQAMTRALSPAPPATPPAGSNFQVPLSSPIQAHLAIGAASPAGILQPDGSRLFDVSSQVNAFLLAVHAHSPGLTTAAISFVFTTGAAGLITVYPPHIAYDVP